MSEAPLPANSGQSVVFSHSQRLTATDDVDTTQPVSFGPFLYDRVIGRKYPQITLRVFDCDRANGPYVLAQNVPGDLNEFDTIADNESVGELSDRL
jgi:hypothetical protein